MLTNQSIIFQVSKTAETSNNSGGNLPKGFTLKVAAAFVVVVFLGTANVVLNTYSMTTGCSSKDQFEENQSTEQGLNGKDNEIESQR